MARLSLRLVIGLLGAGVVLVVAIVTLTITYTVSLSTVRQIGEKHAQALATTAQLQSENYFRISSDTLDTIGGMFKLDDWSAPSDDPAYPDVNLLDKHFYLLAAMQKNSHYIFTAIGMIFDDGAGINSYVVPLGNSTRKILYSELRGARGWPTVDMIGKRRAYYLDTEREVAAADITANMLPWVTNIDVRFALYAAGKVLASNPAGYWFAMTVYVIGEDKRPQFVLPAVKPLYNRTNHFIGLALLAQPVEVLSRFAQAVKGTPNTEVFVVDSTTADGFLVASTHASPFFTTEVLPAGTAVGPQPAACKDSSQTDFGYNTYIYIMCRIKARDAQYAPLREAAAVENGGFLVGSGTRIIVTKVGGDRYFIVSARISNPYRLFGLNFVLCMPESDMLGDLIAGRNLAIGITVGVFVAAVGLSFVLFYALLQPLSDVSQRMLDTARLRDCEGVESYSRLSEIQDLQKAYTNMNTAIKSFTRYVPRDVVKDLMASGQLCTIQMVPQRCTMLFVDIAGFTTICERVPPESLSVLVSQYFDRASRLVMKHDGLIDKFIGDCIMAVWGCPFAIANQETKATLTGVLINRETMVSPLSDQWDEAGEILRVRVGISTGEVLAGNMGSADRMSYTVIGDPVNLAARLEGLNKHFGTRVMVSDTTAAALGKLFVLRYIMPIAVVGKDVPVQVYEVMGIAREFDPVDIARLMQDEAAETGADGSDGSAFSDVSSARSVESSAESVVVVDKENGSATPSVRKRKCKQTALALLREAARLTAAEVPITCTVEEILIAEQYSKAVTLYVQAKFDAALAAFETIQAKLAKGPTLASDAGAGLRVAANPLRSMETVTSLCREYSRNGAPENFTGVYKALEK